MSLAYATELAQKAEAARKEATDYLNPYLKSWFVLEEETSPYYDKNESEYAYDFLRVVIEGGYFVLQTDDYYNQYREYEGTHEVYIPQSFIENPEEYIRHRRQEVAERKEAERNRLRAETEAKIARLRHDLEIEEAKLGN